MNYPPRKRILVVPLNWGLGHATRIIPIIRELLSRGHVPIIGGSPEHQLLLREEFPNLKYVQTPYLQLKLSKGNSQIITLLRQLPKLLWTIRKEQIFLKRWLKLNQVDAIIADNCYGYWHKGIYSVIITHQVNIRLPKSIFFLSRLVNRIHRALIGRYTFCWIPDSENDQSLAGELSSPPSSLREAFHVGILSRFHSFPNMQVANGGKCKHILFILSGPEPQRSLFENRINDELASLPKGIETKVVRGLPAAEKTSGEHGYNHADAKTLADLITQADLVICRSGYSSLMDLATLGKKACLIPTPGQTEQEYLAHYFATRWGFLCMDQAAFSLVDAIEWCKNTTQEFSLENTNGAKLLKEAIDKLLRE